jgi:putative FmdB family regulatory protein
VESVPIYEYRCNECGHQFEVSQRMADDPISECEVCGGQVARVLFAPAIHFKGTGFHNTDYATKRRGAADDSGSGSGDGSSNGAGEKKGGEKGGEKPAAAGSSSGGGKTVGLDKV